MGVNPKDLFGDTDSDSSIHSRVCPTSLDLLAELVHSFMHKFTQQDLWNSSWNGTVLSIWDMSRSEELKKYCSRQTEFTS